MIPSSPALLKRLCEALGFGGRKVSRLQLDFPAAGLAQVTVTEVPTAEALHAVAGVLEECVAQSVAGPKRPPVGLTTDARDPALHDIRPDGQQQRYLVLSEDERAKGFVRPVRDRYRHLACGTVTTMGRALAETYAREPTFYTGTFCCHCGRHFPLKEAGKAAFVWDEDGTPVGS